MNSNEFLKYLKMEEASRCILVTPSKEMLTKKGTVRKSWFTAFFGKEENGFTLPKNGGCLEEGITIYTPDGVPFYLMSYILKSN
jgi:hypothetical protein